MSIDYNIISNSKSWKDFCNKLSKLGTEKKNNKIKGDTFEELTRLSIISNPIYKSKIKQIWHHSKIPQSIIDDLKLQRKEIGVDLLAEDYQGLFWAIQCKYHDNACENLNLSELSSFFAITERQVTYSKLSYRLACTSAYDYSKTITKNYSKKLGILTSSNFFSNLDIKHFKIIKDIIKNNYPIPKASLPKPHQKNAVEKTINHLKIRNFSRGKIIHPCGSGKSLIGFWIFKELNVKNVLISVPSLALVRQTLDVWAKEAFANKIDIDWILVCSDREIGLQDELLVHTADLGVSIDTNPEKVFSFLSKNNKKRKIVITTYHSGKVIAQAAKRKKLSFNLGIFDEAHKTVGKKNKVFSFLLEDKNVEISKRVFLTATERVFKGNSEEYFSMDNEETYGKLINQVTFNQAIERRPRLLSDYKIVTAIVTESEIRNFLRINRSLNAQNKELNIEEDSSTIAALIMLRRLVKDNKIKKIISFHTRIKKAKEFCDLNNLVNRYIENIGLESFHVSGRDTFGKSVAELDRFEESNISLVTNARCLTEGVDIPKTDAVLFVDPKKSKIDIVQAAGRALRLHKEKDIGYILIPVILDSIHQEPENKAFDQIINVISALAMHDERIIEYYRDIVVGKKPDKELVVIQYPEAEKVIFKTLSEKINFKICNRISFGFYEGFTKFKNFYNENKHCNIPRDYKDQDGFKLGSWLAKRRKKYRQKTLPEYQFKELNKYTKKGFIWDPIKESFYKGIYQLEKYIKKYNNADVHARFIDKDNFNLGKWVSRKRTFYRQNKLLDYQFEKLNSYVKSGWSWNKEDENFFIGYRQLQKYFKKNKNVSVPAKYRDDDNFNLGKWCSDKRSSYRKKTLKESYIKKFNSLSNKGWDWEPAQQHFYKRLKEFEGYVTRFKTTVISKNNRTKYKQLHKWISSIRSSHKKNKLSNYVYEEFKKYEKFGWTFDPLDKNFNMGCLKLINYINKNNHSMVPTKFKMDGFPLGQWVYNIRRSLKKKNSFKA